MGEPMDIQHLHTVVVVDKNNTLTENLPLLIPQSPQRTYDKCTIPRVPPPIRGYSLSSAASDYETAYDPKLIAIGPFHRHKKDLQPMQQVKLEYLSSLMARCPSPPAAVYREYSDRIARLEAEARRCYSEEIKLTSSEFVAMMVLDGAFIVEHLIRCYRAQSQGLLHSNDWNPSYVWMDLLLLENQIPFSVLQTLFDAFPIVAEITLRRLAIAYLTEGAEVDGQVLTEPEIHHLLHLHYLSLTLGFRTDHPPLPPSTGSTTRARRLRNQSVKLLGCLLAPFIFFPKILTCDCFLPRESLPKRAHKIPSATILRNVGVEFVAKRKKESIHFLDVSFDKDLGRLEMAPLTVREVTGPVLQNLAALEQSCRPKLEKYFSAYAFFMDSLIDSAGDVGILESAEIVQSHVGRDEEVASYFNKLCKGNQLDFDRHYLKDEFDKVQRFHDDLRNSWLAWLIHQYFDNPWKTIGMVVGATALIATILQTISSLNQSQPVDCETLKQIFGARNVTCS